MAQDGHSSNVDPDVASTPAHGTSSDQGAHDQTRVRAANVEDALPHPAADATAHTPDAPRRRSRAWQVAVPIVALVAGGLFGVSARAAQGTDLRSESNDLSRVVSEADRRNQTRQSEVAKLRSQVTALQEKRDSSSSTAKRAAQLNREVDAAADPAGLTPMTGPSVTVTLDDSKQSVDSLPADGTPDWLVVHQQDVQAVVNALWAGGARGMMLMDQRVISTSAVRCVGNTLILQGRVYSPPFTIRAIGDPVKLKAALDADPSVKIYKQYVDLVGLGYSVTTQDESTFPAFTGSVSMQHAKVAR